MMMDSNAVSSYKEMAKLMAQAQVQVPDHFKGKPADCLAVVMQAAQWQMNPFVVAQKTHVINGTLGYEAQLVNSVVSSSNAIVGRFHYEYQGTREDWKPKMRKEVKNGKDVWKPEFSENACVRVGAVLAGESEITWGEWVYPCDQSVFNSPLWRTNPKQQAGYLAVKFWARFYTPDVIMGAYTPDELHEAGMKDITPPPAQQKPKSVFDRLQNKAVEPHTGDNGAYDDESYVDMGENLSQGDTGGIDESEVRFAEWQAMLLECQSVKEITANMPKVLGDRLINDNHTQMLSELASKRIAEIKGANNGK